MNPITSLDQLVNHVKTGTKPYKIAVALAEDPNTIGAIAEAIEAGFIEAIMIGTGKKIKELCDEQSINSKKYSIVDISDPQAAVNEAVRMVKEDEADILMKGLVGTDKFLKAVLAKDKGLLPPKTVMSYVCALDIPAYDKLLFISDPAVLPFPDVYQKIAMINYSVKMARNFGIERPKVALISANEKVSTNFPNAVDYAVISKMADRGQIKNALIDGPLDVFLACDPESIKIKGVETPINGEADVLIFPTIEACNAFYKGVMLFCNAELGGLIQGTTKPVVVMSRSESPKSKFYCIALACLMVEERR